MAIGQHGDIGYRQWGVSTPRAVFLLVHGLGAHAGRWEALADFFARKNISSYAIELTNPNRSSETGGGKVVHLADYYNDVLRLHEIAVKNNPGKKIFLIGESMGALLSFLFAARNSELIGGLVCISPAFVSKLRISPLGYIKIFAPLIYNPRKAIDIPFDSVMCTRDVEYRKALESDPREYRMAPSGFLFEILLAQLRATTVKHIGAPVLFLAAGDDRITDLTAAKKVFNRLKDRDKALVEFPGMYHSLSVELGKEKVFEEILKWTEKRI